jgi:UDP-N-acetylglucosamine acyltransferase
VNREPHLVSGEPVIGPDVRLGRDVKIHPFVVLDGHTTIGDGTEIYPFSCIGTPPQDVGYKGSPTRLVVGEKCVIRESCSIHRASEKEEGVTVVGSRIYMMAYAHIGHDCRVGDEVTFTNYAALGGHCVVGDRVVLGGHVGVHQFCRIGTLAMVGAGTTVSQDIPPYCLANGQRARLIGLNEIGLERRGFTRETIQALRKAYRTVFRAGLRMTEAIGRARAEGGAVPDVERFLSFIEASKRGVARHGRE